MQTILNFLNDLKANNEREWFHANKKQYNKAKSDFETFINQLIPAIFKFDPGIGSLTAKDCVFRIFRDIRFSPDKTPYKTHFGAYIAKGGRKSSLAGYYLHIDAEESFAAGGLHMPPAENLKKARQEIMYNIDEFKSIIHDAKFKTVFGSFIDEKLKRPPKDFPADFADIDLLKFKGFTVMHKIDQKTLQGAEANSAILSAFKTLKPLNDFLNRGLE